MDTEKVQVLLTKLASVLHEVWHTSNVSVLVDHARELEDLTLACLNENKNSETD